MLYAKFLWFQQFSASHINTYIAFLSVVHLHRSITSIKAQVINDANRAEHPVYV